MTRPLRVFLCHASQDKPTVWKLHRYLKQHGIKPWLDREDLLPGEDWEVEIPRALFASDVILVCLSKNSVNKEGFVQKEITFALDKAQEKPEGTIFIIPVKLEECEIPKRLTRYQWVDLSRPDGRKRLLMGLNKRVNDLGDEVQQIILEDTRQRKPVLKPVDYDPVNRDEINKAETKREEVELEAKENSEHQVLDRAAIEKLELEEEELARNFFAEQTARNKDEKELKESADREAEEKTAIEKLELDAEELDHKYLAGKKLRSKTNLRFLGLGGIILFALGFGGFGLNYLLKNLPVATATVSPSLHTPTIKPPTLTSVPITSTPQPTKTSIPTPTLGIGSTMIGEKGETLVYVPAGEFTMGDGANDAPIHKVYLDAFWIDQTEVTNAMYGKCVADIGACKKPTNVSSFNRWRYYDNSEFDDYPVIYVDWNMANAYCIWADRRLPTEAEWEKAARGTDARAYPWGNDLPNNDLLNYNTNVDTTKVGNYKTVKSFYGTYDMAGNVWEWVSSLYQPYPYVANDGRNDLITPGSRVLRGGAWFMIDFNVSSANRNWNYPNKSICNVGFRCARSP